MKQLCLFVCMLWSVTVSAQEQVRFRRFSMALSYSPDFSYRQLKYSASDRWASDRRNDREQPRLGHTAGISMRWRWTERLTVESGVLYSDKGYRTGKEPLQWTSPDPSYPVSTRIVFRYETLDIPLKLHYYFTTGRWKYYASAGVIMSNVMGSKAVLYSYFRDGSSSKQTDKRNLGYADAYFSGVVGAGVQYTLAGKWAVYAEPQYRQAFTSLLIDDRAKEYLYSVGLNMGVVMQFRKR